MYHGISILICPNMNMRNISRFRLRAHTLKVEAAAWLEDGSCVCRCDQCPGEDKHVQNEVHALLFCQDHWVCELRKHFSFLFTPFSSSYRFLCLARCGFRLLPSFRWDALWGIFSDVTLPYLTPFFEDFSAAQPFLLQQVNNQLVHDFLSQQNNRLFLFLSELLELFVAGLACLRIPTVRLFVVCWRQICILLLLIVLAGLLKSRMRSINCKVVQCSNRKCWEPHRFPCKSSFAICVSDIWRYGGKLIFHVLAQ